MDLSGWKSLWIAPVALVALLTMNALSASHNKDIFVHIPRRGDVPAVKVFVRLAGKEVSDCGFNFNRPTIMMVHGFNGTGSEFYCVMEILSKHFNVVVPDLRGFGRSDQPQSGYSTQIFADDLDVIAKELHLKKFNLLGFSVGGLIAQRYVLQHPKKVRKLILADTTPQIVASDDFPLGLPLPEFEAIQALFATDFLAGVQTVNNQAFQGAVCTGPKLDKLMMEALNLGLQPSPLAFNQWLADLATFSTVSRLSSIHTPTLILVGENDANFPVDISEFLHANIAGSKFRILPGQPHINFLTSFKVFAKLVKQFVSNEKLSTPKDIVCDLCLSAADHP